MIDQISDKELKEKLVKLMRAFLRDPEIPEADKIERNTWTSDPYSQGTYSTSKGTVSKDALARLGQPYFDNPREKFSGIFFAGEGTSEKYRGYMHGARLSGIKAAEDLSKVS